MFTQYYRYDFLGNLVTEIDSFGNTTNYTYDRFNRQISCSKPAIQDKSGISITPTIHKIYTILDQLESETDENGYTTGYENNIFGKPIKIIHPNGFCERMTYLCNGWLSQHWQTDNTSIVYQYDQKGRVVKEIYYDVQGLELCSKEYGYKGSLLKYIKDQMGFVTHFEHDGAGRKTAEINESKKLKEEVNKNTFSIDSIGNIFKKNNQLFQINHLNQIENDQKTAYKYDLNGNLIYQDNPRTFYSYDALNRLTSYSKEKEEIEFIYDAFDRCISIKNQKQQKDLIYQNDQEIGSIESGKLNELKIPRIYSEKLFAVELQGKLYFPLQDYRNNICGLRDIKGELVSWNRYSAYGEKSSFGDLSIQNPWGFSNRRHIGNLAQFFYRYYNLNLMRWMTPDPIDFEDGINLYAYVHNNPFKYFDRDGNFAVAIPLVAVAFGAETAVVITTVQTVISSALIAATGYLVYDIAQKLDSAIDSVEVEEEKKGRKKGKDNEIKDGPPRGLNADYMPDPNAQGYPHTTLGIKNGRKGPYLQGATFDKNGKFTKRTDVTDHGRNDHVKPHYHNATSPNGANGPPLPIL